MKKTIWRPLVLGVVLGLLATIATVTGLTYIVPATEANNVVGFYMTLLLLAAALGGPLAGAIASTLFIVIPALFGPPDVKEIWNDPVVFWRNLLVIGTVVALVGLAYRLIFQRVKMPGRLLLWAGIVIAVYLIIAPANLVLQHYFHGEVDVLPSVLTTYRVYVPQAIFDILCTSLVFVALPARYRRPLWIKMQPASPPAEDKAQAVETRT
jgi:MFS family permease